MNVDLSIIELEDFFQNIITRMLGFNPATTEKLVRIAWPPDGAPDWKKDEDAIFIQLTIKSEDEYSQINHIEYIDNNSLVALQYTRVLNLSIISYGPNSFNYVDNIKNSFYIPTFKLECDMKNIFLIPRVEQPRRFPELFNGQWWDRADLNLCFNEYVRKEHSVPSIEKVEVIIPNPVETHIIVEQ